MNTVVYLCDFHRGQAWDRWCRKSGLSSEERSFLMSQLRKIGTNFEKSGPNSYLHDVNDLKNSSVFKIPSVSKYVTNYWLKCMKRWVNALRSPTFESAINTTNGVKPLKF